jgi:hypothetical protein
VDQILFFDITWIGEKEFKLFGFEKKSSTLFMKDDIRIKFFSFDHWHVQKNEDDFGERFYTAHGLEKIVKEQFGVELTVK